MFQVKMNLDVYKRQGKKKIEVWDLSGFKMEGCPYKLRVVRYHEQWEENGKETERFMWLCLLYTSRCV